MVMAQLLVKQSGQPLQVIKSHQKEMAVNQRSVHIQVRAELVSYRTLKRLLSPLSQLSVVEKRAAIKIPERINWQSYAVIVQTLSSFDKLTKFHTSQPTITQMNKHNWMLHFQCFSQTLKRHSTSMKSIKKWNQIKKVGFYAQSISLLI